MTLNINTYKIRYSVNIQRFIVQLMHTTLKM